MGSNTWAFAVTAAIAVLAMLFGGAFAFAELRPLRANAPERPFVIQPGEGAAAIAARLEADGIIRSDLSFTLFAVLAGAIRELKPGRYALSPAMSSPAILKELARGANREIAVTIPEGLAAREIDAILAGSGVTQAGEVAAIAAARGLEGKLFPDTYRFFVPTEPEEVVTRLTLTYGKKALPILAREAKSEKANLILASLIEREVPDPEERRVVSGILRKRLAAGMPLQVDAAFCYVKAGPCHPLTADDLTADSLYNTYIYKGLPPGPIGNPGEDALRAAVNPVSSPYWFYLSDPKTKKTVFARTLDEHRQNRVKYLNQ